MIIFKTKAEQSEVFCDMLTITLKLEPHEHQICLNNIEDMLADGYAKKSIRKGKYKRAINIGTGENGQNQFLVQFDPKQSHHAFLRVEFNPAKCYPGEVRIELDKIIPCGGYSRLFQNGTCTRVDASIDVHFAAIEKLLFWIPGLSVTSAYAKGAKAGSLVYGSAESNKRVSVYDKRRQMVKANAKTPNKVNIPDHPITRIEVQLKHRFPAKDLAELKNAFEKILISNPSKSVFNDDLGRMFLLACEANGPPRALAALIDKKAEFVEKLKTTSVKWWQPEKAWAHWSAVANAIINAPPAFASPSLPNPHVAEVAISIGINANQEMDSTT